MVVLFVNAALISSRALCVDAAAKTVTAPSRAKTDGGLIVANRAVRQAVLRFMSEMRLTYGASCNTLKSCSRRDNEASLCLSECQTAFGRILSRQAWSAGGGSRQKPAQFTKRMISTSSPGAAAGARGLRRIRPSACASVSTMPLSCLGKGCARSRPCASSSRRVRT